MFISVCCWISLFQFSSTEGSQPDSVQDLKPRVPKLKRKRSLQRGPQAKKMCLSTAQTQPSSVDLKSCRFPQSPEKKECLKKGKPVPDGDKRQLLTECVLCLKTGNREFITSNAFKLACKMICAEVPVLKDIEPPEDVNSEYQVNTVYFPSYSFKMSRLNGSSFIIHNKQYH